MTPQQYHCLTFIDSFIKSNGWAPSFEEITAGLGLKSKSGAHRLVTALIEEKYLRRTNSRARALEVQRRPNDPPSIQAAITLLKAEGYTVLPPAKAA